jgi:hypothetical protein
MQRLRGLVLFGRGWRSPSAPRRLAAFRIWSPALTGSFPRCSATGCEDRTAPAWALATPEVTPAAEPELAEAEAKPPVVAAEPELPEVIPNVPQAVGGGFPKRRGRIAAIARAIPVHTML